MSLLPAAVTYDVLGFLVCHIFAMANNHGVCIGSPCRDYAVLPQQICRVQEVRLTKRGRKRRADVWDFQSRMSSNALIILVESQEMSEHKRSTAPSDGSVYFRCVGHAAVCLVTGGSSRRVK